MKVDEILRSKGVEVHAVSADARIADAVEVLNEKNIGAVVVKNGEEVAGILSERDIVRRLKTDGVDVLTRSVSSCMTRRVHTCSLDASIDDLMALMTKERIRHIPVIENGALVGLVSIGDVVKRKIDQSEQEAAALREYIAS